MEPSIIELAESLCRKIPFPTMIVDEQLVCVYTTYPKFIPIGTGLALLVKEPVEIPLKKEKDVILIFGDITYCARFIPIDKKYSFCQLLSVSEILTLASYTDMYYVIEERFAVLEECYRNIEESVRKLSSLLPQKNKMKYSQIIDIVAEITKMRSLLHSMSDYAYTALSSSVKDRVIDTHEMVRWLVNNSNKVLEKCGKCIEFITDVDAYYIYTNQRYAIIAILNAMQNALLYSSTDNVPIVSLTKTTKNDKNYVVLQIVNDIDDYIETNDHNELDFACRRCGLGIPVIKKFAQRAGGEFYFEKNNSTARIGIMIPEYIPQDPRPESPGAVYDFIERNIIEEMMMDVVSYIAKKKKRR